jgi:hypothetical protein
LADSQFAFEPHKYHHAHDHRVVLVPLPGILSTKIFQNFNRNQQESRNGPISQTISFPERLVSAPYHEPHELFREQCCTFYKEDSLRCIPGMFPWFRREFSPPSAHDHVLEIGFEKALPGATC